MLKGVEVEWRMSSFPEIKNLINYCIMLEEKRDDILTVLFVFNGFLKGFLNKIF